jgi:hypothetical protein
MLSQFSILFLFLNMTGIRFFGRLTKYSTYLSSSNLGVFGDLMTSKRANILDKANFISNSPNFFPFKTEFLPYNVIYFIFHKNIITNAVSRSYSERYIHEWISFNLFGKSWRIELMRVHWSPMLRVKMKT